MQLTVSKALRALSLTLGVVAIVFGGFVSNVKAADSTVVVRYADMATSTADVISNPSKWLFYNDETDVIDSSLGSMVVGPSATPLGIGSAEISVSGTQRRNLATYQFASTSLADITDLRFSTYNPSAGNGGSADRSGYLHFNVSFDGADTWQKRLVFVPSQNGTVVQNSWQEWDAINSGNAMWTWSGYAGNGNAWPDANTNEYRTWNDIKTAFPSSTIRATDSFLGIRVGEPYADGYTENIDKLVFGTASGVQTFDFEAVAPNVAVTDFGAFDSGTTSVGQVKGYSFGFNLSDATGDNVNQAVVKVFSSSTLLGVATSTGIFTTYGSGNTFSAPFDVYGNFDYAADGNWSYSGWLGPRYTIPTNAEVTVNFKDGSVQTATTSAPTGDPTIFFKDITSFEFASTSSVGVIDQGNFTITVAVPSSTDVTNLVPTIAFMGSSTSPASGVLNDFSTSTVYTVTAGDGSTQDYTVTVNVAPNVHTITASVLGDGTISPSGAVVVPDGGSQLFTFTPNTGSGIANIVVDGVSVGTPTSYTIGNVTIDHTIVANFAPNAVTSGGGGGGGGGGTINPPSTPPGQVLGASTTASGSGSAGGSVDTAALMAQLIALIQQAVARGIPLPPSLLQLLPHPIYPLFTRDLTIGSVGADVRNLQQWLNGNGFVLGISGAGSPGNETSYFGTRTRAAVARFQVAKGIRPAVGYFGPITRALLNSLLR